MGERLGGPLDWSKRANAINVGEAPMKVMSILLSLLCATPLAAQVAFPCDWQARADAIVEPWENNTATFADGAVRVAHLDVGEPAAASAYLLILHPPIDPPAGRTCTVVGLDDGLGYAGILFNDLTAEYEADTGLHFTVPAIIHLPEQSFQNTALLSIRVNQSTGDVVVSQELGNE